MAITDGVTRDTFIPKLWEADVIRAYEKNLIAKQICAINPSAPIKKYGDVVHFPGLKDPHISDYVPVGIKDANKTVAPIEYEDLEDTDITLVIDRAKKFNFRVDDVLEAQTQVGVQGSQTQRAGYMLRDECDQYILSLAPDDIGEGDNNIKASQVVTATITNSNVISRIGMMKRILEEANIPNEESYIVIPPWVKLMLRLAGIQFSILEGTNGAKNGIEWTSDLGFDLYVSNNLKKQGAVTNLVGGSKKAMCYAGQIMKTEALRLEDYFADGVRGLHLYGGKIIRPELMTVGVFTEGEISGI